MKRGAGPGVYTLSSVAYSGCDIAERLAESLSPGEIPAGAAVYVCSGVPQVFRRLEVDHRLDEENDWLYFPAEYCLELGRNVVTPWHDSDTRSGLAEPVDVESRRFTPLVLHGRTRALVLRERGRVEDRHCLHVLARLAPLVNAAERTAIDVAARFLTTLFRREGGTDRFLRSVLGLLADQVSDGLAVTYAENHGLYHLRLAVGDIAMWDRLQSELTLAAAERWRTAAENNLNFVPVGFLPETPVFLASAPPFLFVHPALESEKGRSFLAMPVSGDLSIQAAENITSLARLVSALHERNFGLSDDLLAMYGRLNEAAGTQPIFNEALGEVFDMLNRRTTISRVVFVDTDGSGKAVVSRTHADPVIRSEVAACVAPHVVAASRKKRFLLADLGSGEALSEDDAKRYYLDNVKSELAVSVRSGPRAGAVLAVGSPHEGEHLVEVEKLIEAAAVFLALFRTTATTPEQAGLTGSDERAAGRRLLARLETSRRLADGYFHSLMDRLSSALGQAELIDESLRPEPSTTPELNAPAIEAGSLIENLESIVDGIKRLRSIAFRTQLKGEMTPVGNFLDRLPSVFEGYTHRIQDTKGIAVRVEGRRKGRCRLEVDTADMFDYFYPALLAVMDEAICSGSIVVTTGTIDSRESLVIECDSSMIGHTTLAEILQRQITGIDDSMLISGHGLCTGNYTWIPEEPSGTLQRAAMVQSGPPVRPAPPAEQNQRGEEA